jgi:hypothetical protein
MTDLISQRDFFLFYNAASFLGRLSPWAQVTILYHFISGYTVHASMQWHGISFEINFHTAARRFPLQFCV